MNGKKVNWFFLTTILLHVLIVVVLVVFRYVITLGMIANFVISSAIIVVPAFLFLAASREDWAWAIGFHRIKWNTALMIVLFTFLTMPLTTVINAFSMLFVENAIAGMDGQILELPFAVSFLFIAVLAPIGEEVVFRGVVYRGYQRSGTLLQAAFFSALLFALGHLNFNQAAYAFVIGIILALLVEATGSIWSSILYHVIFNGYSVCVIYLSERLFPNMLEMERTTGQAYRDSILYATAYSLVPAVAATAVAACALVWIAENENRRQRLAQIWKTRHNKKEKLVTAPLVIAAIICIVYMTADVILYKMM